MDDKNNKSLDYKNHNYLSNDVNNEDMNKIGDTGSNTTNQYESSDKMSNYISGDRTRSSSSHQFDESQRKTSE